MTPLEAVRVRSYSASTDAAAVHQIFRNGMMGLVHEGVANLVDVFWPHVAAVCLVLSAIVFAAGCGPIAVVFAGVTPYVTVRIALFCFMRKQLNSYVEGSLSDDLRDIESSYMRNPKSHFWVAVDSGGGNTEEILGCVGLEYTEATAGESAAAHEGWGQLRRLSVSASGRRRGIASRLNSTLLAFAQEQQLPGIFLTTSTLQPGAIALYRKLTYEQVSVLDVPIPILSRAMKFITFEFKLKSTGLQQRL
mmetsp:Transcript_25075/g.70701  ORF Transcript_25075/g.70701 Transcript_25075/m.70701 type:complete len:249 (-) Transcript_25075:8-754(-)